MVADATVRISTRTVDSAGALRAVTNWNAMPLQMRARLRRRLLGELEHGAGSDRARTADLHRLHHMIVVAGAARGDDRNRYGFAHEPDQPDVVACEGAVAVDACQQDLAC